MKNKILFAVLTAAIIFGFSCQKETQGFSQYVPADAKFVIQFKSLDTLLGAIKPFLGKQGDMAKAFIGFNPMESKEIKDFGIDPYRPFGMFFTHLDISDVEESGQPDFNMAMAIPVTKNTDFIKKLEAEIGEKMADFQFANEGDNYLIPTPGPGPKVLMKQTMGYLFIAAGKDEMPSQLLASIGQSNITQSPLYQELYAEIPEGAITLYGDFNDGEFFSTLFSQINEMNQNGDGPSLNLENWFKGYRGARVTVDFQSPDFMIKSAALFNEDAPMHSLQKDVIYDRDPLMGIPMKPALVFSFGMNMSRYVNMLLESIDEEEEMAEAQEGLEQLKAMTGLDVKEDLLNNIGGNINFGIFDLSSLKTMQVNGLLTMSLRDSEKILKSMEVLKGLAVKSGEFSFEEKDIDGTQTFIFQGKAPLKIYAGIKDSIILSTNLDVYKAALTGDQSGGYMNTIKEPVLRDAFTSSGFFYLDIAQIMTGLNTALPFITGQNPDNPAGNWIGKISSILDNFKYMLVSAQTEGLLKKSTMVMATNFSEPFFKGIARVIKEESKKPADSEPEKSEE